MTTSRFVKFVRTLALAAIFALPTVALQAQPASALPRSCQSYLEKADTYGALADSWFAYGNILWSLGYQQQALDAYATATFYQRSETKYLNLYLDACV